MTRRFRSVVEVAVGLRSKCLPPNVNYSAGDVVPNAVLAKVGSGGKVCIYTKATSHILADVNGYVT